jgi:GT2 family glycosyltransferase
MISILLAVYNGEKYLHECLNSVLQQSFKNFDEVLVDHRLHSKSNFNTKKFDISKIL